MGDTLLDNKKLQLISDKMMYEKFCESNCDNSQKREKMKRFLIVAMNDERLTNRQRYCIKQYYISERKQVDIAKELGVDISVVNRHISRGLNRIKDNLPYFDY